MRSRNKLDLIAVFKIAVLYTYTRAKYYDLNWTLSYRYYRNQIVLQLGGR